MRGQHTAHSLRSPEVPFTKPTVSNITGQRLGEGRIGVYRIFSRDKKGEGRENEVIDAIRERYSVR